MHEIGQMFYHGNVPWHGLGKELAQPASMEEALAAGGLDWEVELVPLVTDEKPPSCAPQRLAVVRGDREPGERGRVLGVVHRNFRPLQNREGAELFDRLFDRGARKYTTGGWLRNGEVVWLQARLPSTIVVAGDDVVEPYLLYSNSHDGSEAIDIRITTIRVVCRNTLSYALSGHLAGRVFRRAHRDNPTKIEADAQAFFALVLLRVENIAQSMRLLAGIAIDDATFRGFVRNVLPDPPLPAGADAKPALAKAHATRLENLKLARDTIVRIRGEGIPRLGIPPEAPTWWGSVNAVTAWSDHVQKVNGDRLAHAMFGVGDRFKTSVFDAAHAMARGRIAPIGSVRREANAMRA